MLCSQMSETCNIPPAVRQVGIQATSIWCQPNHLGGTGVYAPDAYPCVACQEAVPLQQPLHAVRQVHDRNIPWQRRCQYQLSPWAHARVQPALHTENHVSADHLLSSAARTQSSKRQVYPADPKWCNKIRGRKKKHALLLLATGVMLT